MTIPCTSDTLGQYRTSRRQIAQRITASTGQRVLPTRVGSSGVHLKRGICTRTPGSTAARYVSTGHLIASA
eukprot:1632409-Rhodomonas_salina.1